MTLKTSTHDRGLLRSTCLIHVYQWSTTETQRWELVTVSTTAVHGIMALSVVSIYAKYTAHCVESQQRIDDVIQFYDPNMYFQASSFKLRPLACTQ